MVGSKHAGTGWKRWLRRKIVWLLAFKLAALLILWMLFFSPAHRASVDSEVMSKRLAPAKAQSPRTPDSVLAKDAPDDV